MAAAVSPGTRELLREFSDRVHEMYGSRLVQVILFGSQARGDASPDSAVDVVLVFRDDVVSGQEITRLGPLLAELNLRFERLISVVPHSLVEYETRNEPFLRQVRREGVMV
ncbi:MAG: nucleotidyltransferase domain-containing protein [Anaerolineae bacterium]